MVISQPDDTDKANLTSISVIVPFVVPFSEMFAPIIGIPSLSTTVPVICFFCCVIEKVFTSAATELLGMHNIKMNAP